MRFDLFSSGKLYRALRDAGYPDLPSERTVGRWTQGKASPPLSAVLAVSDLLGLETTKEPPAPPEWVEGLEARLTTEIQSNRAAIVATLSDRIGAAVVEGVSSLLPPPTDEQVRAGQDREG